MTRLVVPIHRSIASGSFVELIFRECITIIDSRKTKRSIQHCENRDRFRDSTEARQNIHIQWVEGSTLLPG